MGLSLLKYNFLPAQAFAPIPECSDWHVIPTPGHNKVYSNQKWGTYTGKNSGTLTKKKCTLVKASTWEQDKMCMVVIQLTVFTKCPHSMYTFSNSKMPRMFALSCSIFLASCALVPPRPVIVDSAIVLGPMCTWQERLQVVQYLFCFCNWRICSLFHLQIEPFLEKCLLLACLDDMCDGTPPVVCKLVYDGTPPAASKPVRNGTPSATCKLAQLWVAIQGLLS